MYMTSIKGAKVLRCRDVAPPPAFSPHHEAVVGRNGTRMTNFFDAIRFVLLADKFKTLQKSDRTELLHEGRGVQEAQACVELVFDNVSRCPPYDKPEVTLKHMVALAKDEFFVNGKKATKEDATSMFESAGSSRSNPCVERGARLRQWVQASTARRARGDTDTHGGTQGRRVLCQRQEGNPGGRHLHVRIGRLLALQSARCRSKLRWHVHVPVGAHCLCL